MDDSTELYCKIEGIGGFSNALMRLKGTDRSAPRPFRQGLGAPSS